MVRNSYFARKILFMEMNTPASFSEAELPLGLQLACLSVKETEIVLLQQQHTVSAECRCFFLKTIFGERFGKLQIPYSSSHDHGSGKWVPPIVSCHLGPFSTPMIMGEWVSLFVKDAATGTIWGTPASPPPNMVMLAGFLT